MFLADQLHGSNLAEGELCFTFDDGPGSTTSSAVAGPRTLPLARFMADAGVPCTFFMCGRHIAQHPEIPGEVEALGHTVGNHTENHWNLDQRHEFDMVEAVGLAYQRLRDLGIAEPIPFRAPYGAFPRECADLLNAREELRDVHYGPVHWDIDAGDWSYWRDRKSASECADAYYAEIATRRRGIVLMHDSTADITDFQLGNRTLECVQLLIPRLKAAGMSFKTLAHAVGLPTRGGEVL